ncbi:ABC transporter ATP-binding protein [Demequina mangrovi]|uniref:ABC-type multidrug transport system, ATPase component n=1 Tax=Demequina mangrovi TaxID=1043493 RepID=A0A1H6W0Z9_9MICO|nr:ABC transporter ATP-binding protein [Demequina mangrovi]SEJ10618.1 ABC-type multidrug transport system, ATPase component [Demequina mangrovi]
MVATSTAALATAAVSARGVARAFGSVQAVADATLEVQPGTVTALIGPNGCGKTTLMLMLAGLLRPDAGEIRVAGADPRHDAAAVRDAIGWMPDQLGSWDNLTCLQTLTLVGRAFRLSRHEARERGAGLLEMVHLSEFADRPTRVLSRGQKQRLSIARALMNDPTVLLMDEPANGLDPRSRIELRTLVRELAAEGKAVLISSHVLAELDEMVDDAVFMSKGRTLGDEIADKVADAKRRYRVATLDDALLREVLAGGRVPFDEEPSGVIIRVGSEAEAAQALAWLMSKGVPVHRFGPAGSALEQTYMTMEEERR